jgi:4-diphosphocytidyl-2C-methyl-D-erythritol kinase
MIDAPFDWGTVATLAHNDFESVVAGRHSELAGLLAQLREMPSEVSGMSGSGSTLFLVHLTSGTTLPANLPLGVTAVTTSTVNETAKIMTEE